MRLLGLPPKLRLAPLWPALAAVAVASVFLWSLLPGLFERSSASQLHDTLRLFAPVVAARTGAPNVQTPDDSELQRWVRRTGADSGLRITLIRQSGTVIADSSQADVGGGVGALENHSDRPEVRQALRHGQGMSVRRSATTGQTYVYAAQRLTDARGRVLVLRLAQPLEQLRDLRRRLAAAMVLAVLAAGAAILLTSLWLDRRLFEPLHRLILGAGDLAAGRSGRVEVPDEEELAALALSLNRLAETAETQFAAVRAERDHLKAILASMAEGVLVVGTDGRAQLVNPAFCQIFDLSGQTAGKPVLEIVRHPELARVVEDTLRLGEAQAGQIELHAPERRTLLLASAPLSGGTGGAGGAGGEPGEPGAVVVARDTTELTRVADMRRDFVANVSHELKTPLAAIRGYAETLRDGALEEPPTARRFTERILFQCRRLQALLDDLLTLSRLEATPQAGREARDVPEGDREPVELPILVRRAVELLSAVAREKQVRIEVEQRAVPRTAGDADALERMIVNLVDNAIKYNRPDGLVTVRLKPADGQILLEVEDTGIGIPQDALARIFERFYRVDKGRAREEGGTGLGLAIVKHVAQSHGGQVEVESRMGKGTTFRVWLPVGGA